MNNAVVTMTLIGVLAAPAAHAATTAQAVTALNLRAGPGPDQEILSVIPADGEVTVESCLESSNWCKVSHEGDVGWAYGDYLTVRVGDAVDPVVLYENRDRVTIKTVRREDTTGQSAVAAGTIGAIAGAVIGGPAGAALGGVAGAGVGAAADPGEEVTTYVETHPAEPVYLEGEVVVGAGIPEVVDLQDVPESEYVYAYVNGVPILVDAETRRVVHILR